VAHDDPELREVPRDGIEVARVAEVVHGDGLQLAEVWMLSGMPSSTHFA